MSGLAPAWRRRSPVPIAGLCRYAREASIKAVRAGPDPVLVIEPRRTRPPLEYPAAPAR